jgi:hypothetical protein
MKRYHYQPPLIYAFFKQHIKVLDAGSGEDEEPVKRAPLYIM